MSITTKRTLRMVFETNLVGSMTITLADPKEDLTPAEIESVMDLIISKNVFSNTAGHPVAKKDVKIVETITEDLYDA